jgi:hypothetical protein
VCICKQSFILKRFKRYDFVNFRAFRRFLSIYTRPYLCGRVNLDDIFRRVSVFLIKTAVVSFPIQASDSFVHGIY